MVSAWPSTDEPERRVLERRGRREDRVEAHRACQPEHEEDAEREAEVSPTRLTMKAFIAASLADCFLNQKPISR